MSVALSELLSEFVLPLLAGRQIAVTGPIRPRDVRAMTADASVLRDPELSFLRLRRARSFVADPQLPPPDEEELRLWIGLHNILAIDHPDRGRVWARSSAWRRVEAATRNLLALPRPGSTGEGLVRHLAVGAFEAIQRVDTVIATQGGELRYLGQEVPRRRLRFTGLHYSGERREVVRWREQPHAAETVRLLVDAKRASPLSCLLDPVAAPEDWSPLSAADFLQERAYARACCYAWASRDDWIRVGASVMQRLLQTLDQDATPAKPAGDGGPLALGGEVVPTDPASVAAVVGALIHLHFLRVLELEARVGMALGSREPGIRAFLAVPLLLPRLQSVLGSPLAGLDTQWTSSAQTARRWAEYVDHLEELLPKTAVENLVATLLPQIVKAR